MDWITKAKAAIENAEAVLITAGAGFGVDSGLPDFRGEEGFWNAYPPYRRLGKGFVDMANPQGFRDDAEFAWGFYGHRLQLYRETIPHDGFRILKEWADRKPLGGFVMTSNVDGHFQRAGFSGHRIYEVHGSIHHLQCQVPCAGSGVWSAEAFAPEVEESTMRAKGLLPRCPKCDAIARPNILMFGDGGYLATRNSEQETRLQRWLSEAMARPLVILEFGAGTAVPTVRMFSERTARAAASATLVRVNPREPEILINGDHVSIPSGSLAVLQKLAED